MNSFAWLPAERSHNPVTGPHAPSEPTAAHDALRYHMRRRLAR